MQNYWLGQTVMRRGIAGIAQTAPLWILVSLLTLIGFSAQPNSAQAQDSVGSGTGDLFHSKGWIRPEIYRKAVKSSEEKTQAKSTPGTATRTAKNAKALGNKRNRSIRKRKAAVRSSPKLRTAARSPVRKKQRAAAKARRVPPRLARRLEGRRKSSNSSRKYAVQVASLGIDLLTVPKARSGKAAQKSITGGGLRIRWVASKACLSKRLRAAIRHVALNFGSVRVNSTCRSRRHNRRVGGARRSWHLKGRAADIRVFGNIRKAAHYLRRIGGGYKHYGGGLFHIDTGPRRRW